MDGGLGRLVQTALLRQARVEMWQQQGVGEQI
jgi:hypothetical protein